MSQVIKIYKSDFNMATNALKVHAHLSVLDRQLKDATDVEDIATLYPVETERKSSIHDKPSPLDFDTFLPWICLEWQVPEIVVVIKMNQEEYVRKIRKTSSIKSKSSKSIKFRHEEYDSVTNKMSLASASATDKGRAILDENTLQMSAYYDVRGHLVEIAIVGCPFKVNCKVIRAINLCVPFHQLLNKLSIRKGGLSSILLYEISKLLPHSNITDICLDDSYVPEGNYDVLLEKVSQLKSLSLSRCKINDVICKRLAEKIYFDASGITLAILNLSSNEITDAGILFLGEALRTNRHLLHLNISDNNITSDGLMYIMKHLMKFALTPEEILKKKNKKTLYCQKRSEVYKFCLEEVVKCQRQKSEELTSLQSEKHLSFAGKSKQKKNKKNIQEQELLVEEMSIPVLANLMTKEITGEFNHPFDDGDIFKIRDIVYCSGNFKLCSLNVAYNNLDYCSLNKILEVLKYQNCVPKPIHVTGLLRLVLDGNYIPQSCSELDKIEDFLKQAIADISPSSVSTNINFGKKRMSIVKKQKASL